MIEITVPTCWEDVTADTYHRLKSIKAEDYETPLLHTMAVMSCLCNTPDVSMLTAKSFNEIALELKFINEPIPKKSVDDIRVGGKLFRWKGSLNQLTMGEMVSIEQIIDLEELTYDTSTDVIAAVLLREINKDGKMLDFDSNNFAEYRGLFGGLPITDLKGTIDFFSGGGIISTGVTPPYLVTMNRRGTTIRRRSWLLRKLLKLRAKITGLLNG